MQLLNVSLAILALLCVLNTAVAEDDDECKCFMYTTMGNENDTREHDYCSTPQITSWKTNECFNCVSSSRNEQKVKLPCPQNRGRDFSKLPEEVTKEVIVQFLNSHDDKNDKVHNHVFTDQKCSIKLMLHRNLT